MKTYVSAGSSFTANQNGANYRWLNCTTGYSVISGETGQTFNPTTSGNYAVEVLLGSCVDTSSCYSYSNAGVTAYEQNPIIHISPNPTTGSVNIELDSSHKKIKVIVTNVLGQTMTSQIYKDASLIKMDLPADSGIYFIQLSIDDNRIEQIKIVKE